MKRFRFPKGLALAMGAAVILTISGCTGADGQVTFLDIVNTILLGVTAAGGYVIIQNA